MNIFKKFFSKKEKGYNSDEPLPSETEDDDLSYACGDTVLLGSSADDINMYDNIDDTGDRTVLLSENELAGIDNGNSNDGTVVLNIQPDFFADSEAKQKVDPVQNVYGASINENVTEPLNELNFGDYEQSNDDTAILNRDMYHSGNTVVLNKADNSRASKSLDRFYLINPSTGEKVQINKKEFKIGSNGIDIDLVISSAGVSRHHASIYIEGENKYSIMDNGSTNGTEVEGIALEPFRKYQLENEALIMFANEVFQFYIESGE